MHPLSTSPTNILLVEDNANDVSLIEDMLQEARSAIFRCQRVEGLNASFDLLSKGSIDIVLLDLSLPDSQGLETLIKLCPREVSFPIIVLTGNDDDVVGMKAVEQGAQDYLVKGQVTSGLLARSIRYAIERKRSERQLERLAATLEHDNRELKILYNKVSDLEQLKTDMLRVTSHDLLGILAIVSGYIELLSLEIWDDLSDDQREYFGKIVSATKQMGALTREKLSLEHIETAAADRSSMFDLKALAQLVFQQNRPQAEQKAQRYELDCSPEALFVAGDSAQLEAAITNIVNNAIKYTPDQGTIRIRLKQDGTNAIFEVQDTGYGIPPEMQGHLFQEYFRVKTEQTQHIQGTGLGLYLVKRIIERHQGQMFFQSVQGQGSLFGFRVPLVSPETRRC